MEFDPADLVIDVAINDNAGWREFNCDIIEDDLSNMLEPLGKPVTIVIFFLCRSCWKYCYKKVSH